MKKNNGHNRMVIAPVREYLGELEKRRYSPKTLDAYRKALDRFLAFVRGRGRDRLQDVDRPDIESYRLEMAEKRLSEHTRELYMRSVRQFFCWLEKRQHIFSNPAMGLKVPKAERKLHPVPTEAEMKRLLAEPNVSTKCGLRDRALLETAYSTGARREELIGMNVCDPDLQNGRVRITGKGRKQRVVPLGRHAVRWLKLYLSDARPRLLGPNVDEQALWVGQNRKRLHPEIYRLFLREYAVRARIKPPVTPHGIRRACATHMLRGGAHPVQIQMLLGHSSLGTLGQYLRVTIKDLHQMHSRSRPGR